VKVLPNIEFIVSWDYSVFIFYCYKLTSKDKITENWKETILFYKLNNHIIQFQSRLYSIFLIEQNYLKLVTTISEDCRIIYYYVYV